MTRSLRAKGGLPPHPDFLKFVDRLPPSNQILGLTHITSSYLLRDVVATGRIEAYEPCDVLNEPVIYAFYGRAAFRGRNDFATTTLSSLFPSVLVLDPSKCPKPKYVFPFDSGAFVDGMMDSFLHPYMPLFDFVLTPEVTSAAKLIRAVFGTNENFLENKPQQDFSVPPSNFEAEAVKKIILASSQGQTGGLDDRASTPEFVFSDPIMLRECVLAAVIPDTLAADADIGEALKRHSIPIYEYPWMSGSRPGENHFVIRNLIHGIYRDRGWI